MAARRSAGGRQREPGHASVPLPPLGFLRPGVFADRRWDVALLWGVVAVLAFSRWLAFPNSIWDQDEANFALGVLVFDPLHNQPHAPFFPLWIALGKLLMSLLTDIEPGTALGIVGAVSSVWMLFPLASLFSSMMPRALALVAVVLVLLLPGPWLLAGRAYTEPTATALFVAAAALWLPRDASRCRVVGGGVLLAAALLTRPQWLIVAVPVVLWRLLRSRTATDRALVVGVTSVVGGIAVAVVATAAGGFGPMWAAVEQHRRYIAGASAGFEWGYGDLAVHAAVGGVTTGTAWILSAVVGGVVLLRDPASRRPAAVVLGLLLAPHVVLLLAAQNPTLPRYALPLLALSAGPVLVGLRVLLRQPGNAIAAAALAVLISAVFVVPALGRYRTDPSPVVSAFEHATGSPRTEVLAVDRRLVAMVTLERTAGRIDERLLFDYQVELGLVASSFRPGITAVVVGGVPPWVAEPAEVSSFVCEETPLRRVASPRFLELTVVEGCALVRPEHPSIRAEDLRPGAVIPAR